MPALTIHKHPRGRSIAVIGDTKPYRVPLKMLGGHYHLVKMSSSSPVVSSWLYPVTMTRSDLHQFVTNANNGMYESIKEDDVDAWSKIFLGTN